MGAKAEPQVLQQGANRFRAGASELQVKASKLRSVSDGLSGAWTGKGGAAFRIVAHYLSDDLRKASDAMQQAAGELTNLARRMERVKQLEADADRISHQIWQLGNSDEDRDRERHLRYRMNELNMLADQEARAADRAAAAAFDRIAALDHSLHTYKMIAKAEPGFWDKIGKGLQSAGEAVGSFFKGVYDAGKDAVVGIWDAIVNFEETFENIMFAIQHPIQTFEATWKAVSESWERDVINGDANSRAHWFGYAVGTIATSIIGTKGADKAVKLVKAASKADGVKTPIKRNPDGAGENGNIEHDIYANKPEGSRLSRPQLKDVVGPSMDSELNIFLSRVDSKMTREEFNAKRLEPLDNPSAVADPRIAAVRGMVELSPNTIMQRVIPKNQVESYLKGEWDSVSGFTARAQDVLDIEDSMDMKWQLRLDYNNPNNPHLEKIKELEPDFEMGDNAYLNPDGSFKEGPLYLIRFHANNPAKYSVPTETNPLELMKGWPMTGNGFLGGDKVIPEFRASRVPLQKGSEIYIRHQDGTEELVGKYLGGKKWDQVLNLE